MGYIGFIGYDFRSYFSQLALTAKGQITIAQNCLDMFNYTSIPAFILRLAMFFLLFSTYPLVHYFLNSMLL